MSVAAPSREIGVTPNKPSVKAARGHHGWAHAGPATSTRVISLSDFSHTIRSNEGCLVLGAGASLANALHFHGQRMSHTRPPLDATFFATAQSLGIPLSPNLRTYFESVGIDSAPAAMRRLRMEEVFKDVFFDFQDDLQNQIALGAYIDLVDLYLRVLRETTNWLAADSRRGAPVGRLIAAAAGAADDVTIVTFNPDLVIENEIQRRAQLRRRWCLERGYGTFSAQFGDTMPRRAAPIFVRHDDELCDHSRPIQVLKMHGSLNWVSRITGQRPSAGLMSGNSTPPIHLLVRRSIGASEFIVRTGAGRTRWRTWPLVVPPVYSKQALRARLNDVWHDARSALEAADRVVVFGYSLPLIDVDAEKMIERSLAKNAQLGWLDVIDPAPAAAQRYAGLASGGLPLRWHPSLPLFLRSDTF